MRLTRHRILGLSSATLAALGCALAVALPATAHPALASAQAVKVVAGKPSEYRFTFSVKSVKTGAVTFTFTNEGTVPHDLAICSSPKGGTADTCAASLGATQLISPGATAKLSVSFKTAGKYEYLCTFPGHAALGMKGDLTVT